MTREEAEAKAGAVLDRLLDAGFDLRGWQCKMIVEAGRDAILAAVEAERAAVLPVLVEARECVADWGSYAGEYFQEKHDLTGDLAKLDAAIAARRSPRPTSPGGEKEEA